MVPKSKRGLGPPFIGVDGCRLGWIAVIREESGPAKIAIYERFADLMSALPKSAVIAVDMPIGLPDHIGRGGRGPEQAVRPLLGERQSSVFSIPSRSSVYAKDYAHACQQALATSSPPRKVSKQAFFLFPKIREIDAVMTPQLQTRLFEVHPELAFWRLNGERAMTLPKKIKGRVNPAGIGERRSLLIRSGYDHAFVNQAPPKGAGVDDLIDACACALIAENIAAGKAWSFPSVPERDRHLIQMAIWA